MRVCRVNASLNYCAYLPRGTITREIRRAKRPPCVTVYQELPGLAEARAGERGSDEIPAATYSFRLFNGKKIELYGGNLYRLGDQLCQGAFTGDDFCDVSWRA